MKIRDAHAADFPSIAAITNHYIQHTRIHFAYQPETAESLRAIWEKSGKGAGIYPYLVMENDHAEVIAYAKAGQWRERTAYARSAEIGIYIHHAHCGQGLGRTLYAALIDRCRTTGLHTLIGGIALPNDPSVKLHERLGFQHVGTFRQVGWKLDAWHDVGFWQLMLDPR